MKMVMAVIKPFKLDAVRKALTEVGVEGMTATEAKGFGRQKGQAEIYRGAEYNVEFVPKIRVEVVTSDDKADSVIEAIRNAAHSGQIGDGKIFVFDIGASMRIRTGEIGDNAL